MILIHQMQAKAGMIRALVKIRRGPRKMSSTRWCPRKSLTQEAATKKAVNLSFPLLGIHFVHHKIMSP
jgi:hypothetical protein